MKGHTLNEHVQAMDRLNSYVRSADCRRHYYTSLHDVVYTAKVNVIRACHHADIATHRAVFTHGQCRRCGGSGLHYRWHDYSGQKYDAGPCWAWACVGGKVRLDFIETTIDLGGRRFVWHSPNSRFHAVLPLAVAGAESVPVTDWQPNQVGRDLTTPELARDLNTIETAYAAGLRYTLGPQWDRSYHLRIGSMPAVCAFCRGPSLLESYSVLRHSLNWTAYACKGCAAEYREHWQTQKSKGPAWVGSVFDSFPEPDELLTDVHVAAWAERHRKSNYVKESA